MQEAARYRVGGYRLRLSAGCAYRLFLRCGGEGARYARGFHPALKCGHHARDGAEAYERAKAVYSSGKGVEIPSYMRPSDRYEGYKYPHDYPNSYVEQQYLPSDVVGQRFYEYGANKNEQAARAYWEKIKGTK